MKVRYYNKLSSFDNFKVFIVTICSVLRHLVKHSVNIEINDNIGEIEGCIRQGRHIA